MSPWIRLDDDYIYHPKFKTLSDRAFRLWHEGMAYCRKLMTDGFIPTGALDTFSYAKKNAVEELSKPLHAGSAPLWEPRDDGYEVHDYLQWNAAKDVEVSRREASRERLRKHRVKRISPAAGNALRNADSNAHCARSVRTEPDPVLRSSFKKEDREPSARSKRPIFAGNRLTVFEWQLDECAKILGKYLEGFNLDLWFNDLDQWLLTNDLLVQKRDNGEFLFGKLLEAAKERGLPLRVAGAAPDSKQAQDELTRKVAEKLGFKQVAS